MGRAICAERIKISHQMAEFAIGVNEVGTFDAKAAGRFGAVGERGLDASRDRLAASGFKTGEKCLPVCLY